MKIKWKISYVNLGDGTALYGAITLILILIRFIIYRIFAVRFGRIRWKATAIVLLLLLLLRIWATLVGFVHWIGARPICRYHRFAGNLLHLLLTGPIFALLLHGGGKGNEERKRKGVISSGLRPFHADNFAFISIYHLVLLWIID